MEEHAHAQSIKVDRRRRRHILTELSSRPFVVLGIEGRGYREFDRRRRMMIYGRKGRKERRQIGEKKGKERETETRGAISGSVGAKIRGNCCSSLRADQQARDRNDLRGRSRVPIDRVTLRRRPERRDQKEIRRNRAPSRCGNSGWFLRSVDS